MKSCEDISTEKNVMFHFIIIIIIIIKKYFSFIKYITCLS